MSGEIFTWCPAYGASETRAPRLIGAAFGDGYGQRARDGLNHDPQTWTLRFSLDRDDTEAIEAFLYARGGDEWFYWSNPRGELIAVVNETRGFTRFDVNVDQCTAVFRQTFEPAAAATLNAAVGNSLVLSG